MRLSDHRPSFLHIIQLTSFAVLAAACSVYDADIPERHRDDGGSTGSGGTNVAGGGGTAGNSGAGGSGGTETGGTAGSADAAASDAADVDAPAALADAPPLQDALRDGSGDATEIGSSGDGGPSDTSPPDANIGDTSDASTGTDTSDAPAPPSDGASDGASGRDADASPADADSGVDASDGGPTGPQILPRHGSPIEKPDAGGPFDSRCASDEVVTGFVGRQGVQTDAIASTCSRLVGGVLSNPHNLPLNGNLTGGNAFTVACPANYVAVGIVGRYGHNTMWMEDVTTAIGVVCKDLASTTTQIVTISGQPALDAGYTSFREDCTGGRYLTDISGLTDSNSLGYTVQQVGGECNVR